MNKEKSSQITVLRGIAVTCVVIYHYSCIFANYMYMKIDFGLLTFAVPMFFSLSAFFLYKKACELQSPMKLVIYRLVRLYPAYWGGCTLTYIIRRFVLKDKISLICYGLNLTMFENIVGVEALDGVYWTMVYEIVLLGILFCFLVLEKILKTKIDSNMLCSIWIGLGMGAQIFINASGCDSTAIRTVLFASSYIPSFIFGIILSDIYFNDKPVCKWTVVNAIASIIYEIAFRPTVTAFIALIGAFFVWSILFDRVNIIARVPFNKMFLFLGSISYPLYLCHRYIGELFGKYSERFIAYKGMVLVVSLGMAFVSSIGCGKIISFIERNMIIIVRHSRIYERLIEE